MPVYAKSPSMSFLGPDAVVSEKKRPIFKSQLLDESAPPEKLWIKEGSKKPARISYGLFLMGIFFGIAGGAYVIYTGFSGIDKTKFCPILEDNFSGGSLNSAYWQQESSIGGANAEDFVWYTNSPTNSYVKDGLLNIVPSLTSEATDLQFGINNNTYLDLGQSCTVSTPANCIIASTSNTSITIPPVRSASITTRGKVDMTYGRVEVVAKMPTGDWLWPRISLVPSDDHYGAFPASGLIDIAQSKGNIATKQADNLNNHIQSGIHWGAIGMVQEDRYWITNNIAKVRRKFFNNNFYTFGVDWTPEHIFVWMKTRNYGIFNIGLGGTKTFYQRGNFALLTTNGTVIVNPWVESDHPTIAPFDQKFFLRLQVGAGGLDNYFADGGQDQKPWKNTQTRATAMSNFATKSDAWLPTWGNSPDRGLQVKSVKMWQKC